MSETSVTSFGVYQAITAVQEELAKVGVGKDHRNQQQGYAFRGIDDVYNALAPVLAKHKLCILPRVLSRTATERSTKTGGVLFSVVMDVEFDFVSAIDGSKHTIRTFGEAMDSADKATNKAMSAAYKYACFQTFCIPTEGSNDADANSPSIVAASANNKPPVTNGQQAQQNNRPQPQQPSKPSNSQSNGQSNTQPNSTNANINTKPPEPTLAERLASGKRAVAKAGTPEEVLQYVERLSKYPFSEQQKAELTDAVNVRMQSLAPAQTQNVDEIPF